LVHALAGEWADNTSPPQRQLDLQRAACWYLHVLSEEVARVDPTWLSLVPPLPESARPQSMPDLGAPGTWLDAQGNDLWLFADRLHDADLFEPELRLVTTVFPLVQRDLRWRVWPSRFRRAAESARTLDDQVAEGLCLLGLGTTQARNGSPIALDTLRSALDRLESAGHPIGCIHAGLMLVDTLMLQGQPAAAAAQARLVWQQAKHAGNPSLFTSAAATYVSTWRSDSPDALTFANRITARAERLGDLHGTARALQTAARIRMSAGVSGLANDDLEDAYDLYITTGDQVSAASVVLDGAHADQMSDHLADAKRNYEQALTDDNPLDIRFHAGLGLARCQRRLGDLDGCLQAAGTALNAATRARRADLQARARLEIGAARRMTGATSQARPLLHSVRAWAESNDDPWLIACAQAELAKLEYQEDNWSRAASHARAAAAVAEDAAAWAAQSSAHLILGELHLARNHLDQAHEHFLMARSAASLAGDTYKLALARLHTLATDPHPKARPAAEELDRLDKLAARLPGPERDPIRTQIVDLRDRLLAGTQDTSGPRPGQGLPPASELG
jgi:tetratricopeptide (TPR) repeat protein